jgi:Sec-independent protein translocase protein TatA
MFWIVFIVIVVIFFASVLRNAIRNLRIYREKERKIFEDMLRS